jgi:hypothetical protein
MTGKTTWWFPDGDLPEPVPGDRADASWKGGEIWNGPSPS